MTLVKAGWRDRWFVIVFGIAWMLFSSLFYLPVRSGQSRLAEIAKWPLHPATVISSEVGRYEARTRKSRRTERTYPRIVYRYEVEGVVRTNETSRPNFYVIGAASHAIEVVQRFNPGAKAQARVNPSNPFETELEGAGYGPLYTWGKRLIMGVGSLGLVLVLGGVTGQVKVPKQQ